MGKVTLRGLSKSFGSVSVIPDLNLDIADGEFVVLVGPSGCGKTTALRMIAGLEESSGGAILIDDRDVTYLRPGLRDCAMVFQNYALYPHMNVGDNIRYGMKIRKRSRQEMDEAVKTVSGILGLSKLLDRKPRDLSGGQRQRVAIGRALVRDPQVFLFDEPLSNLDAKLRIEMRTEIKKLHQRLCATMVYVTHDQVEAMTLADRVVVMRAGVIEQADTPLSLYERPANKFVAGFIGAPSMNFLTASVKTNGKKIALGLENGSTFIPSADSAKRILETELGTVIVGFRPEHVMRSGGKSGLALSVDTIETLGSHKLLIGSVGQDPFVAEVDAHDGSKPGETVIIDPNPEKAHFFNPSTERAI